MARALVVRGGWDGHFPVAATEAFLPFLHDAGFTVQVEEDPEVYADESLMADVDLVLQCISAGSASDAAVRGLAAAVERGTGLAGWHGGIVDSFRASSDYLQLVGGQFAMHPAKPAADRRGDGADYFVEHTIDIVPEQREHPIVAGLDDFTLTTEQYWVLTDSYSEVLATTTLQARPGDPWHRPVTCPAVWTRAWGAGRVFVATPGHDPAVLEHPSVRAIVERGIRWASR
jgi:type 1 glutamine amidotransferase